MATKFIDYARYMIPTIDPATIAAAMQNAPKQHLWTAPDHDYVGVEIEMENVANRHQLNNDWWTTVHDGSLRVGLEYKTHPIPPRAVPYALHNLFDFLKAMNARPNFSERTSIHVHVDFREQTDDTLLKLILTYLVFEKYLYLFAGPERYKNNFCIPLSEINVSALQTVVGELEKKALTPGLLGAHLGFLSKYSGLNVMPLFGGRAPRGDEHNASGSIEFRHMAGTHDQERISTWVAMLQYLKDFAIRTPYEEIKEAIVTLNTTSRYQEFANAVFGPHGSLLLPLSLNWKLLSASLALTKQALSKKLVVPGTDFLRSPLAAHIQSKHDKVTAKHEDMDEHIRWEARDLADLIPPLIGGRFHWDGDRLVEAPALDAQGQPLDPAAAPAPRRPVERRPVRGGLGAALNRPNQGERNR